jgi:diguanylate cyclase (GGDEF)-like protein/PAS domain S-box-containing protein
VSTVNSRSPPDSSSCLSAARDGTSDHVDADDDKILRLEHENAALRTALRRVQTRLAECQLIEEELDWIFKNSVDLLIIHDEAGQPIRVSPSVERVLGYSAEEFAAIDFGSVVHPDDLAATTAHLASLGHGETGTEFVARNRHKDGDWRWIAWSASVPRTVVAGSRRFYVAGRDITLSRLTEQALLHRAQHDALTRLANRAHFDQLLEQALGRAGRSGRRVGLMLVDLDGFKSINDTHGHQAGDVVLKLVAERLQNLQRRGDLVARLGGDEFAYLMEDATVEALDTVAARILAAVCAPITVDSWEVHVGCSIGISSWAGQFPDAHQLFQEADLAMYGVKSRGKRTFAHYEQ